jgi:hypothetical protein
VELGPGARVAICVAYLSLQATLIATGGARADHAFAFQMFSESCTVRLSLQREVEAPSGHGTLLVPAARGEWTALDAGGTRRRFEWSDRVKAPLLSAFETTFEAGYGERAEIARLEAALDDVTNHLEGDAETERLVIDATFRRNGREPTVVRLSGPPRSPRAVRDEQKP